MKYPFFEVPEVSPQVPVDDGVSDGGILCAGLVPVLGGHQQRHLELSHVLQEEGLQQCIFS